VPVPLVTPEIIWWYRLICSSFEPPINTEFFLYFEKSTPSLKFADTFLLFIVIFFFIGVLLFSPSEEFKLLKGSFLSALELDPIMLILLLDMDPPGLL
jgi:hypothetical protein